MSGLEHRLDTAVDGLGQVEDFALREALDSPYVLSLHCRSDVAEPFDALAALEQDVVLEYGRPEATSRRVAGMILRVRNARHEEAMDEGLVVEVGPALALLGRERQTRIFQERTVPQILEEVLGEALSAYGRTIDVDLTATYEPREYCVQWQETTLDFVSRLMAEEGIAYHFDHAGPTEVLALRDDNARYPELAANDGATVLFSRRAAFEAEIPEAILAFHRREQLGRTHVAVRDHDWTGPATPEGTEGEADAKGRERESFEHGVGLTLSIGSYEEGVERYQKNDAARQPALRLEADRTGLLVFEAEHTVPALAPGHVFALTGSPGGLDGRYLVTRTDVSGDASEDPDAPDPSRHTLECVPIDVPYRPARVQTKPRVTGAEVATVVGPSGQEIHTDPHGRIKVRFPWDRGETEDPQASCWIRVAQRWAGGSFGTLHVPRIGMSVVVRYVHGDPDRPVVTGALYDGANHPPYALPGEKTKSTIKSNTSLGGGGFNELRFEDKAGDEQVFLHAQKDHDEVVLANHTTTVGHDQTNHVHNDQTQTIHTNQTEDVHANQTMKVKGKRNVTVLSGFEENVDGTEKRTVSSGVTEIIVGGVGQKRSVKTAVTELITGGETRLVIGGQTEDDNANHTRVVLGNALRLDTGAFTHTASGDVLLQSGSMVNSLFGGALTATGGPTVNIEAPVIIEFANSHTETAPTKTTNTSLKVGIYGLVLSGTLLKMGLGGLSVTLAALKLDLAGAKAEVTGASIAHTFKKDEVTAASCTATGILIDKASFQSEV